MIVVVNATGRVDIEEADLLTRLYVEIRKTVEGSAVELHGALGTLGSLSADGSFAWLDPSALREAARSCGVSEDWDDRYEAMLTYATSKGWVDDAGRIRAHIEQVPTS